VQREIEERKDKSKINLPTSSKRSLEELSKHTKNEELEEEKKAKSKKVVKPIKDIDMEPMQFVEYKRNLMMNQRYSEGKTAPSFTSTRFDPTTENKLRPYNDKEIRDMYYCIIKSRQLKCYVTLQTNMGDLNLEIYSHLVLILYRHLKQEKTSLSCANTTITIILFSIG
jgi:hypothetical protein